MRPTWCGPLSKKNGRAYLSGMPNESEVDYEFWAHCRADGAIEVGAAAESHVGKGARRGGDAEACQRRQDARR